MTARELLGYSRVAGGGLSGNSGDQHEAGRRITT